MQKIMFVFLILSAAAAAIGVFRPRVLVEHFHSVSKLLHLDKAAERGSFRVLRSVCAFFFVLILWILTQMSAGKLTF